MQKRFFFTFSTLLLCMFLWAEAHADARFFFTFWKGSDTSRYRFELVGMTEAQYHSAQFARSLAEMVVEEIDPDFGEQHAVGHRLSNGSFEFGYNSFEVNPNRVFELMGRFRDFFVEKLGPNRVGLLEVVQESNAACAQNLSRRHSLRPDQRAQIIPFE
jgi:hypothetical protein